MTTEDYQQLMGDIPRGPGVYRFLDKEGVIIYVGKAKNLRARTSNYFGERRDRAHKTRVMVRHADRLEFTLTETETDALLLENSFIKKYQPRYNVALKDGKSYSYLCIKNERFPRIFITRNVVQDGSTYFGPYTSKARIKVILDLIKQLFPLRTCTYHLLEANIAKGKFQVCLEYHMKNCLGPCEGLESEEHYDEKVEQIRNILKGNFTAVKQHFYDQMMQYAENLEFEQSQLIKEKLSAFENYQAKSMVVSATVRDVDVFSIATDEEMGYIHYLKVVNGAIIHTHTQELVKNLDEEEEDLLAYAIPNLRERFNSIAGEIIVPRPVPLEDPDIKQTIPQRGDKFKLLELSQRNVTYYRLQKRKDAANRIQRTTSAERIMTTLKNDLRMSELPTHIECFDNSNIQGSHPVAACVVFKQAKPSKKDYRHYHIKTVEGPNDFASMEEVVHRRYRRLQEEGQALPQLVIIDGGKGQLSSAMQAIDRLGLRDKMTVVGIAKRLEEIFFPDDAIPLYIDKKSESLKLIQQARNEAHRFAITFHRKLRNLALTTSELTEIPGVGEKTAQKLLVHFGSVKKVRAASITEVAEVVGQITAQKVKAFLG